MIDDASFGLICGAFGWPLLASAEPTAGGVFAVTVPRHGPEAAPAECFVVLGATEAEALTLYRRQVVLKCAQLVPALAARVDADRERIVRDEAALAVIAGALAPAA